MAINNPPHIHENVVCANVFIRKDGKYLVLRRSPLKKYAPNVVHPFGGKVDPGENPFEAAVREVREESGVSVKNMRLEAVVTEISPHKSEPYNWLIFHFSADYDSGEVISTEEGELVLLTAEQLKGEELYPSVRKIIGHVLNREAGTVFATFEYDENGNHLKDTDSIGMCMV